MTAAQVMGGMDQNGFIEDLYRKGSFFCGRPVIGWLMETN